MAGALPDGFPADIPLYRPSSLVDFTPRPEGGAWSSSRRRPRRLRSAVRCSRSCALPARQARAGNWTKAGRKLRLVVEATPAGARFRYDF